MHCLVVSWALDLGACFFSNCLFLSLHLCIFISSYWLCYSSLPPCGDPPQFIIWRIVTSFPPSISRTLRRSSCQREFVCYLSTWGCVHLLSISSLGFICSRSGYAYLYICKKKKIIIIIISTCVYVHSVLDHWVCILMFGGHFYRVCSLLGVRMWALWDPMLFVLLRHIYLWERWVTFS